MLPLPTADFEACIRRSTFVSKQALVQHETNFYSAPVCQVFHQVTLKVFAERIEIVSGTETVAVHRRCWGRHEFFLDYSHYLALLASKPGGLNHARPFQGEPWGEDLDRLRIELEYRYGAGGVRQFIDVLLLLTEYPEASVKAAVGQCVGRRAFSSEAVKSVLDYQPPTSVGPLDLSRYPLLQVETDGVRDAGEYDQALLDKEDVA